LISSETKNIESAWLAGLKRGEEGVLRSIFNHYYPAMVRDAHRLIKDTDTCRDLAQDVFVELWKKRDSLAIHSSLSAYLRRSVVNKALNHLKSIQKTQIEDADDIDMADNSLVEAIALENQNNLEAALHAAVDLLPEKCRVVFVLSRFEEMSHKEIAEKLSISVKTIENQITKAMKTLREIMLAHRELSSIVIFTTFLW
jgi:RNA polymerase sigma-70 factor, ECF subfamily